MRKDMKFRNAVNGFNKTDVLTCIETLLNENAEQKKKIKDLEDQLFVCRTSLEDKKNDTENKEMCEKCDAVKVAQAQLGAAMLDAKRFSEMLLKDANDKSAQILNKAMSDVTDSTATASDLADSLLKAKEKFVLTLDVLHDELTSVILSFTDFQTNLKAKGEHYDFTTDFAATPAGETK